MKRLMLILSIVIVAFSAACSGLLLGQQNPPAPQAPPTAVPVIPTAVVEPTRAPIFLVTATPEPTITQAPTRTPTAKPSTTTVVPTVLMPVSPTATVTVPVAISTTTLKVAYVQNENVYLWQEGGTSTQLTKLGNVTNVLLSDDGKVAVYQRKIRRERQEIWAVNTEGGDERQIVDELAFMGMDANGTVVPKEWKFIPKTHILTYNTRNNGFPGYGGYDDIRMVNVDTAERNTILWPWHAGADYSFSPDATKLLVMQARDLVLRDADAANRKQMLDYDLVNTYSNRWFWVPQPWWGPGNKTLRVVIPPRDPLVETKGGKTVIWELYADGQKPRQLSSFLAAPAYKYSPMLSPDGSMIAYLKWNSAGTKLELHISDVELNSDKIYATGDLNFIGWAADSKNFALWIEGGKALRVGKVGGEIKNPLSVDIKPWSFEWTAGNRFVYMTGDKANPSLFVAGLDDFKAQITAPKGSIVAMDAGPK